jgi:hypothetical protein
MASLVGYYPPSVATLPWGMIPRCGLCGTVPNATSPGIYCIATQNHLIFFFGNTTIFKGYSISIKIA